MYAGKSLGSERNFIEFLQLKILRISNLHYFINCITVAFNVIFINAFNKTLNATVTSPINKCSLLLVRVEGCERVKGERNRRTSQIKIQN